jgi:Ca-activated chloride channel family protein
VDDLKYQEQPAVAPAAASGELLTVKLRYKGPDAPKEQGTSSLVEFPVKDEPRPLAEMDRDFQLAASVAGFGMLLRDSPYKGTMTWAGLDEMTRALEMQPRADPGRHDLESSETERRREFRELVKKAAGLSRTP